MCLIGRSPWTNLSVFFCCTVSFFLLRLGDCTKLRIQCNLLGSLVSQTVRSYLHVCFVFFLICCHSLPLQWFVFFVFLLCVAFCVYLFKILFCSFLTLFFFLPRRNVSCHADTSRALCMWLMKSFCGSLSMSNTSTMTCIPY